VGGRGSLLSSHGTFLGSEGEVCLESGLSGFRDDRQGGGAAQRDGKGPIYKATSDAGVVKTAAAEKRRR